MKRYEELEHTADYRVRIFGADEKELFANAAYAFSDSIVDAEGVSEESTDEVEATGGDLEETLVNFLSALLYRFEGERRIYRRCEMLEVSDKRVRAACRGEEFDRSRHRGRTDIKAVTFHGLEIRRGAEGLTAVVTFDI